MKKVRALFGAALFFTSLQALAWGAISFDKETGYTFTSVGHPTEQAATSAALNGCKNAGRNSCILAFKGNGGAFIVAKGEQGSGVSAFYVRDNNPEKASVMAMSDCRQSARNCKLMTAIWDKGNKWIAISTVDGELSKIAYNIASKEEAEAKALTACNKEKDEKSTCALHGSSNEQIWVAITKYGNSWMSDASAKQAKDAAQDACRKAQSNKNLCEVDELFHNESQLREPESMKKVLAKIEAEKKKASASNLKQKQADAPKDCRPRTQHLQCTSQCTNGNCVVTYKNGCQMRVQVNPVFNGSTWNYPAPSC